MAAKLTLSKGYAAGAKPAAISVPWAVPGLATGTFNRGTPTASTGASPAAGAQSLPVDPAWDAATGAAQRNLSLSQSGLAYQRQQLGSTYGFGINSGGVVVDDPSNPYSRAAALQESYRRAQAGTNTSMAGAGQLYSGAYQNAVNENVNQNQKGRDALIRQFLDANQNIQQRELQAGNDYQSSLAQAGSDRITRALANRPDPASVPQTTTNLINVSTPVAKPKAKAKPKVKK